MIKERKNREGKRKKERDWEDRKEPSRDKLDKENE